MPRGTSGRIVIEVEPELKDQLYTSLERQGKTLKEWFLERAEEHLYEGTQLGFQFETRPSAQGE